MLNYNYIPLTHKQALKQSRILTEKEMNESTYRRVKKYSNMFEIGDLLMYNDQFIKGARASSDINLEEYEKTIMLVTSGEPIPFTDGVRIVVFNQYRQCFQRPTPDILRIVAKTKRKDTDTSAK